MSPTARQMDALRFVKGFNEAMGYAPSLRAIASALGYASHTSPFALLGRLEERGLVRVVGDDIEVLSDIPVPHSPDGEPLYFVRIG